MTRQWLLWLQRRYRERKALRYLSSAWVYLYRVDPTYCSDPARKVLADCIKKVQLARTA